MLDIKIYECDRVSSTCSMTTLLLSDYFWEVSSEDNKRQELTLVKHKYQLLSRQMWSHYNTLSSSPGGICKPIQLHTTYSIGIYITSSPRDHD